MCFSAQPGGGFVPECLDGHCVPAAGIQTIFLNKRSHRMMAMIRIFKKKNSFIHVLVLYYFKTLRDFFSTW